MNYTFKESPFDEDKDIRGFVVHKITCFIDGEEAGYIKLSYVDQDRWDEKIKGNPWRFRSICSGHHDLPEKLFDSPIDDINKYYKEHWTYYGDKHGTYELEKAESNMKWFEHYYVNKPIVDFIRTNDEFVRRGVATALHMYAVIFLRERFGLKLYKSTCIVPGSGKAFYNSSRVNEVLKCKKELAPDKRKEKLHYLNVDRNYFIYSNKIKNSFLTKHFEGV